MADLNLGNIIGGGLSLYDYFKGNQTASNVSSNLSSGYKEAAKQITDTLNPYMQYGAEGTTGYKNLLENPSQLYQNPGYKWRMDQGQQALERSAAQKSNLLSGGNLADIIQYGQNYATNELDSALQRYIPLMQMGYGAATTAAPSLAELYKGMGESNALRELMQYQNLGKAQTNAMGLLGALGLDSVSLGDLGKALGIGGAAAGGSAVAGATAFPVAPNPTLSMTPLPAPDVIMGENGLATGLVPGTGELPATGSTASAPTGGNLLDTFNSTPAVMNLTNIGLGALGANSFMNSGATGDAGKVGSAVGAAAGSLVPLMGPVTGAAGAMLGGIVGNLAGSVYKSITGDKDKDWAIRYDANGQGMTGKGSFTTPLGTFGFSAKQTRNMGESDKAEIINGLKDQFTQMDNTIANALTPTELSAVKQKMNGFEVGAGSNATAAEYGKDPVLGMTKKRLQALKSTLSPERLQQTGLDKVISSYNDQFKSPPTVEQQKEIFRAYSDGGNPASIELQYPGITAYLAKNMSTTDDNGYAASPDKVMRDNIQKYAELMQNNLKYRI